MNRNGSINDSSSDGAHYDSDIEVIKMRGRPNQNKTMELSPEKINDIN
jgi:hypothetical protein